MPDPELEEISQLTIEELMQIEVISVAGIAQEWFQTPAAMYVITGEDIRRAGHRSLAEALRLAPGVFVGRTGSHAWSIGMRGFNGGLANKTLVLVDGRSIYDPLFSGTFWDIHDVVLEDVDRIEVIRGPGPTLWGSNAVNGVINIITKSARDTQGLFITGGGGTEERAFGSVRYGGAISDNAWFSVWSKYIERDSLETATGGSAHDDWNMFRGGFRLDFSGDNYTWLTVQGQGYNSCQLGESIRVPDPTIAGAFTTRIGDGRVSGGHILARVSQEIPEGHGWSLQSYYDRTNRMQSAGFEVERDTFDLDFRHHFDLGERNEILWGLAFRHTADRTEAGPTVLFDPADRSMETYSAFVQDTITIVPDRLFAMIGSKFEHNDVSGFEFQPSGRLWWTPDDRHTLWAAVSRAVRVPSRTEEDVFITALTADEGVLAGGAPTGELVPLGVSGDPDVEAERLVAYELGHRVKLTRNLSLDTSLFYNDYDDLIFVPPAIIGTSFNNDGYGETYGGEIAASWRAADNWTLVAAYSLVDVQVHGPILNTDEASTPTHQAQLRSMLDITKDLEFNTALYYVDNVPVANVPRYFRFDAGFTWRPRPNLEIAVWGQNLLDDARQEFSALQIERGFYVQATIRF